MAGYSDTKQMIINALTGRPEGTKIQPKDHQAFALQIVDYIRSVELVGNASNDKLAELQSGLAEKQNIITDLESIRDGANKGSTALQAHQDISHLLPKIDFTTYETKTDSQIKALSDRVDELDKGEVFIMDNTLVFRNYADAKIEGETLKF